MKHFYISLIAFLTALPFGSFAQNTLTVHQKNGQQFSFGFDEKPVVSFTDSFLVVKSTKMEVQYELALVSKFTFDDVEDAVIGIKDDSGKSYITLDEYTICIIGMKANATVSLIASDGKLLQSCKADKDGSVTFSIAELPEGTYIISSESLTCKIMKR